MSEVNKRKFDKKKFFSAKKSRKSFMEVGHRGFLATCNFREKDCLRETYNVLNEFADQLYGPVNPPKIESEEKDEDIEDELNRCAKEAAVEKKVEKRFQQIYTETPNLIFVKTTIDNPGELGLKIFQEIAESQKQRTRFLLRLIPVQEICKANLKEIINQVGRAWDQYVAKDTPVESFAIVFNKRYNNDIVRDDVLKELADLIKLKRPEIKVDLKNAKIAIIVEILKGLCCVCIAPDYFKYKKYNLFEICNTKKELDIKPDDQNVKETEVKGGEISSSDEGKTKSICAENEEIKKPETE